MISLMNLHGGGLLRSGDTSPNGRQDNGDAPAQDQIQFVVRVRLKDHHCDQVVQVEAFDEHPHEHGRPSVLQRHVERFADHVLQLFLETFHSLPT